MLSRKEIRPNSDDAIAEEIAKWTINRDAKLPVGAEKVDGSLNVISLRVDIPATKTLEEVSFTSPNTL